MLKSSIAIKYIQSDKKWSRKIRMKVYAMAQIKTILSLNFSQKIWKDFFKWITMLQIKKILFILQANLYKVEVGQ